MPYRDDFSRLCGPLNYRDTYGNWQRKQAILDENLHDLRFFNHYVYCPENNHDKNEKLWDLPDLQIFTRHITKIEKKEMPSGETDNNNCFEIQMFDTTKYLLKADSEQDRDEWINHLHRVAVDPTRRQEGPAKNTLRQEKNEPDKKNVEESKPDSSPEHISYETKIIGGVVVRRPVSKQKGDSDNDSLSGGSFTRSMSGGGGKGLSVIKQGYLVKKGAVVRNWKRRFFKLDIVSFSYYEKETDKEPIRSVATSDILHVRHSPSSECNKDFLFEVQTGSRTFLIQADNQADMEDWIHHLQNATQSIQARSHSGPAIFYTTNSNSLPPPECLTLDYYSTSHV